MKKILLYQPDIAGNVGTIIRNCACFGFDLHIIEPCGFPFDLHRIKKSGLDYVNHVKIFRHNSFDEFYEKEVNENRIILATTKGSENYAKFNFKENDILMFGKESAGVPDEIAKKCHGRIVIPMKNNMRSLNVAISCGIIMAKACE